MLIGKEKRCLRVVFARTDNLREWFISFSYCKRARFSDIISIRNKNRKESVYVNAAF